MTIYLRGGEVGRIMLVRFPSENGQPGERWLSTGFMMIRADQPVVTRAIRDMSRNGSLVPDTGSIAIDGPLTQLDYPWSHDVDDLSGAAHFKLIKRGENGEPLDLDPVRYAVGTATVGRYLHVRGGTPSRVKRIVVNERLINLATNGKPDAHDFFGTNDSKAEVFIRRKSDGQTIALVMPMHVPGAEYQPVATC